MTNPTTAAIGARLHDAVRVPLDSLHADADYLVSRVLSGSLTKDQIVVTIRERIDAAKAALASAVQQPADYAMVPAKKPLPDLMMASYHEAIGWNACIDAMLAAAPKPAQIAPLSENTLKRMHHEDQFGLFCDYDEFEQIARAIEAAHGITAGKEQKNG